MESIESDPIDLQDLDTGMALAYLHEGYRMQAIAAAFKVHYATVSRAVRKFEGKMSQCKT